MVRHRSGRRAPAARALFATQAVLAAMVIVLVSPAPPASAAPSNNAFASALSLTSRYHGTSSITGMNTATSQAGEPIAYPGQGKTVWWSWTAPQDGTISWDTTGSTFDTVLAIYTGTALSNLQLVDSNDDGSLPDDGFASRLRITVTTGTTYYIQGDSYQSEDYTSGSTMTLRWGSPLDDFPGRGLSGSTGSSTSTNEYASCAATEYCVGSGHSIWFTWTAPSGSTNQFYTFDTLGSTDMDTGQKLDTTMLIGTGSTVALATYDNEIDQIDDVYGINNTLYGGGGPARLTIKVTAGVVYRIQVDTFAPPGGNITLRWSEDLPTDFWNDPAYAPGTLGSKSGDFWYKTSAQSLSLQSTPPTNIKCLSLDSGAGKNKAPWVFQVGPNYGGPGDGLRFVTVDGWTALTTSTGKCSGTHLASVLWPYQVDDSAPSVTGSLSPPPNNAGWNNTDVNVTWTASDAGTGIASGPTPASNLVTQDGITTLTSSASDALGHVASGSVTVRRDTQPPALSVASTPPANGNGWNNTDVLVSFACADQQGLSGLAESCPSPVTLTAEGTGQTVSRSLHDNAGNLGSATSGPVNIDRTPPAVSSSITQTSKNGWYDGDVTVSWICSDTLSGLAQTCPASSAITGEGRGLQAMISAVDRAGNQVTTGSAPVDIDRTAPTTRVAALPVWNNTDVSLALLPSDNLSGVAVTRWTVDGGPTNVGTSATLSAEGRHEVTFWSEDVAGNVESQQSISVNIDKTSPTITHLLDPGLNAAGWASGPVTVTFTCADELSGIATCSPARTVSTEGADQPVTGTATDNAGNTALDHLLLSIDQTPPDVSADVQPAPNEHGWIPGSAVVTPTCTDSTAGIADCSPQQQVGEGPDQDIVVGGGDRAGNRVRRTVRVSVDATPPILTGAITGPAEHNGWRRGDTIVHWTCSDALSGIDGPCPGDSRVTGEGTALAAVESVRDLAGNVTTARVDGIRIDRTAPHTTATAPSTWSPDAVLVTLDATDSISGVASTSWQLDDGAVQAGTTVTVSGSGEHTLRFWSEDVAGNVETATSTVVRIDSVAPAISHVLSPPPNAKGWNNSTVAVAFSCTDQTGLSGVASCTMPQTVSDEGRGQDVTGTARDAAGNTAVDIASVNLDETPPTIVGQAAPAANSAGWVNSDVTVTFSCADELSGVATCSSPSTLGEGVGQSVTGSSADNADNTAAATVSGINVDETPPSLSGAATTAPNAAGWYRGDVTIQWTCADELSGIAGSCPSDSLVSGEGDNRVVAARVSDRAGNVTDAMSAPVAIDRTPPTTSADPPSSWVNSAFTVHLDAADNLSGVAATYFELDGHATTQGTAVTVSTEGVHSLRYWSVDRAGNTETPTTVQVRLDKGAPTITHAVTPELNSAGWQNQPVTVTFTCTDDLSGISTCTAPRLVDRPGKDQVVTGSAVDNAGNTASDLATVSIDTGGPSITAHRTPAANGHGWNRTDVVVAYTCTDDLSGVVECSDPESFTEGAGQAAHGRVVDAAGNIASASVSGINVDETPPLLAGIAVEQPNDAGWYRDDVTVRWACSDQLSGIEGACPADSTLLGEGPAVSATAAVRDNAGNESQAESAPVKIDRAPPVTTTDAPGDWQPGQVSVTLSAVDGLSGVDATYSRLDDGETRAGTHVTVGGEGVHSLRYWSVDRAGNVEPGKSIEIRVDQTPPTITHSVSPPVNGHGWFNTDVTVSFQCADAMSGLASCSDPTTIATEGKDHPVVGTATDHAGNTSTDVASVSIDKTAPTVVAIRSPLANDLGWNNGSVTVSFRCSDALSGIDACPDATTVGEGAAQTVAGTARDAAGNESTAGVDAINVDTTPPALSGAPVSGPNANGWYRGDVPVRWVCTDDLSGIDGSCPADTTITGEGSGLTSHAAVADRAGNVREADSAGVAVDRTPPVTTADPPADWQAHDVTVTLSARDTLSGVATTHYVLDGGAPQLGTSVTLGEGAHSLRFWSVDRADNVEPAKTVQVLVDESAPSIDHTVSPSPNAHGWSKGDLTVTFHCTDALSGIASCTEPTTLTGEGQDQLVTGTAVDGAGNSATDNATVSIDRTPPTISGARAPAANAYGWVNSPVSVSFTCTDALSGISSCSAPSLLGEGVAQEVSGSALDAAGNLATAVVSGLNVDLTGPSLVGEPTTQPNSNGWYHADVTVHWTCADALSGLDGACPADNVVTGEGGTLSVQASATDKAGNTRRASSRSVAIDTTAPVTTADAPTDWQASDVVLHLTPSDALSGVAVTRYAVDGGSPRDGRSVTLGPGVHSVRFWSVDRADNQEPAKTVQVRVDETRPTITGRALSAPNSNGWYAGPVTVRFTCGDDLSGIVSCPADVTLDGDGANQSAAGTAIDNAGNAASVVVSGINIDSHAPSVTVTEPDGSAVKASYPLGAVPTFVCHASDPLSGIAAPCTRTVSGGTGVGVGTYTVSATAMDRAGNTATTAMSYRVTYVFDGFLQPVNDTAHQTGLATSVFKGGSTVPVKVQLKRADGTVVVPATAPVWTTPQRGGLATAAVDESVYPDPATAGGSYRCDAAAAQCIFNWSTKGVPVGYFWRIGARFDDGTVYYASVGLR